MTEQRDWLHDLECLRDMVYEEILPKWRSSEHNSRRDYPSTRWLNENGYSNLRWILKNKHDLRHKEFFELILNLDHGNGSDFEWNIDDSVTIKHSLDFLDGIKNTRNLSDQTWKNYRSVLNGTFRHFAAYHGEDSLYGLANDLDRQEEAYEMFEEVICNIKQTRPDNTAYAHLRLIQRFYEWLDRHHRIEYNPVEGLEEEFKFDFDSNTVPLTDEQVRKLWTEAADLEEYILIVGYVLWGLRTEELPRLHIDQFILESKDPRYDFNERKNGPGIISVEHGLMYVAERFDRLQTQSDFDGTLFDVHKKTLKRRFNRLAERAGVTIDGSPANPAHGRNYWMDLCTETNLLMLEVAKEIIPDRGSTDPQTALESYTDEQTRRKYRRFVFRFHLENVLPGEEPIAPKNYLAEIENQHQIRKYVHDELEEEFGRS